jgi:preprotein translocase subunit SecE
MSVKEKIVKYWQETQLEIKKVAWPSREEMVGSTIATIVMSALVAAFIWVVDLGVSKAVIALYRVLA